MPTTLLTVTPDVDTPVTDGDDSMTATAATFGADATTAEMDFIAVDFEHCNSSFASLCSAGWARVTNGDIVHAKEWMIRPEPGYDLASARNLELTGLRVHDIARGRSFRDLGPKMAERLGRTVVVCHNISADMGMFEQAWWVAGLGPTPTFRVVDTIPLAKQLGLPAKLPLLHEALFDAPMPGDHHDAKDDATATARIAIELFRRHGVSPAAVAKVRPSRADIEVKLPKRNGGALYPIPPVRTSA